MSYSISPEMVKLGALLQWGASASTGGQINISRYPKTWVSLYKSLTKRKMHEYTPKGRNWIVYKSRNKKLIDFLESQGFVFKKGEIKVPDFVRENTEYLAEYFSVLYDSKGLVRDMLPKESKWHGRSYTLRFGSFSLGEAEDLQETFKSIGIKVNIQKHTGVNFAVYIPVNEISKFGEFIKWKSYVPEKNRKLKALRKMIEQRIRVDPEWIEEWKKLREESLSYQKIADRYGVSPMTVWLYLKNKKIRKKKRRRFR